MEHPKLMTILERNIDTYWREMTIVDFDQLLAELERCNCLADEERQSLLIRLGLKKLHQNGKSCDHGGMLPP